MADRTLDADDREFFQLVRGAAFANPFGARRHEIDARIAEAPEGADRDAVVDRLLVRLRRRLDALSPFDVHDFPASVR